MRFINCLGIIWASRGFFEISELIEELEELEKVTFDNEYKDETWNMHPRPDVKCQVTLDYLAQICEALKEKYRDEILFGDKGEE